MPQYGEWVEVTLPNGTRKVLRTGYTTGACATAAAAAATRALVTGQRVDRIAIHLPIGRDAEFAIHRFERGPDWVLCSVIKDAGDDPDVTHGAEICARVRWRDEPGILLEGGKGVGRVTRPGLGLEVGGPAINPVPRKMITEHVAAEAGDLSRRGLEVIISVPRGEELARRTLNPRLGIVGGISILGTTGIVMPWSTAAYRASVEQAVDVAAANGLTHLVLATGNRSERFAILHLGPLGLPDMAFVEMGEFTGHALRRCQERGIRKVTLCGMVGKFAKIAQGHFMTHVAGNQVDPVFLAGIAEACGAPPDLVAQMRQANTARHFYELALAAGLTAVFPALAQRVAEQCHRYVGGALAVEAILFDFDGKILGRAEIPAGGDAGGPGVGGGHR